MILAWPARYLHQGSLHISSPNLYTRKQPSTGQEHAVVEMLMRLFEGAVYVFEVLGVLAMLAGIPIAVVLAVRTRLRHRDWEIAFVSLRRATGLAILLGLELLVAADIIKTLIAPGLEDVMVLGIIVIIRTVLSFALQIEIEGVLPWRRALLTTSPHLIAHAVRQSERTHGGENAPLPEI